jgi:iron complex outermembrane receptor protein
VTYRGRYLTSIPAPNGADVDGMDPLTSVDLALRYALSPHLRLTAEGANLTGAVQRQYSDRTLIPTYQHQTGREFRAGLRWDF